MDNTALILALGVAAFVMFRPQPYAPPAPQPQPQPTTTNTNKRTDLQRIQATEHGALEVVGGLFHVVEAWF